VAFDCHYLFLELGCNQFALYLQGIFCVWAFLLTFRLDMGVCFGNNGIFMDCSVKKRLTTAWPSCFGFYRAIPCAIEGCSYQLINR